MIIDVSTDDVSNAQSGRRRHRELRVSTWLGAGAVGVGVGAAILSGAAAAHADGGDASGGAGHRGAGGQTSKTDSAPRPSRGPGARAANTPEATAASAGDTAGGSELDAIPVEAPLPAAATPEPATSKKSDSAVAAASAVTAPVSQPAAATPVITPPAANQVVAPKASATGSATGWKPGSIISIFVSDGTIVHPDAGLLIGNGFSYNAVTCAAGTKCDGGRSGFLWGNGGNGWNGGNGGNSGLMGDGGNGGPADRFTPGINGGNGGSAGFFWGNGGQGGNASTGANGGNGGRGGLFFGVGGSGGVGGPGTVACQQPKCTVTSIGGSGGDGARGGLFFGTDGRDGAAPLPLSNILFVGYNPVYPVDAPSPPYDPNTPEINPNGSGNKFPDDTNPSKPYAVPGTVVNSVQLPAGFAIGRFGYPLGSFMAPRATYFAQLALPPLSQVGPYFEYVVKNPAALPPGYRIEQSQVAPWFGQPGGGVQYRIIFTDSQGKETDGTVQALLDSGYLGYQ